MYSALSGVRTTSCCTHPPVARYIIGFGLWLQDWSPDAAQWPLRQLAEPGLQPAGRQHSKRGSAGCRSAGHLPVRRRRHGVDLRGGAHAWPAGWPAGRHHAGPVESAADDDLDARPGRVDPGVLHARGAGAGASDAAPPRVWPAEAWLPVAVGVSLALAAATKISGGIAAVGLGAFALIQQALALARTRRTAGLRGWIDLVLAAVMVFMAVNPLLYPSPIDASGQPDPAAPRRDGVPADVFESTGGARRALSAGSTASASARSSTMPRRAARCRCRPT